MTSKTETENSHNDEDLEPEDNGQLYPLDTGVMLLDNGSTVLVVEAMPEQVLKYSDWASSIGIPLPQFMREAAELLCNRLALVATLEASDEIKTEIEREDNSPLVLN